MAYDPNQGPAMPPELMQLMSAAQQPAAEPAAGGDGVDDPRFEQALAILEQVLQSEPDEADSSELAKHIAGLYKLRAGRVKEFDDAMGGKMSPRLMRKGYGQ